MPEAASGLGAAFIKHDSELLPNAHFPNSDSVGQLAVKPQKACA